MERGSSDAAPLTVVSIDPDLTAQRRVRDSLASDRRVVEFSSSAEAMAQMSDHPAFLAAAGELCAIVLSEDVSAPSVLELVDWIRGQAGLDHAAIILTRRPGASAVLDTLTERGSVFYFLTKPVRPSELQQAVQRAADAHLLARENAQLREQLDRVNERLARENRFLKERVAAVGAFEGLLGDSVALKQALAEVERVKVTDTPVHLQGETGTGKELVARALHGGSARAAGPFIAVNCGGMSESLLQSGLFGHRRGSFTGADRDHAGVFVEAHRGTLFLDEVAELSPMLQGALLRALQEGEVTPVGSAVPVKVDVRIVSATHADLRERVRAGRFREDLYFRLVVVPVRLPPLRERHGDVPLLARHFLDLHRQRLGRRTGELTPETLQLLKDYPWPGNIRELEHEMERLVVLADEDQPLGPDLLSAHLRAAHLRTAPPPRAGPAPEALVIPAGLSYDEALDTLRRRLIEEALSESGGSLAAAAARLGVDRSRLGKLRLRLGVGDGQ